MIKRDGRKEPFSQEKITKRLNNLLEDLETEYMGIEQCIDKVVKYAHTGKFLQSFLTFRI